MTEHGWWITLVIVGGIAGTAFFAWFVYLLVSLALAKKGNGSSDDFPDWIGNLIIGVCVLAIIPFIGWMRAQQDRHDREDRQDATEAQVSVEACQRIYKTYCIRYKGQLIPVYQYGRYGEAIQPDKVGLR